jgi:hypothetical protein
MHKLFRNGKLEMGNMDEGGKRRETKGKRGI